MKNINIKADFSKLEKLIKLLKTKKFVDVGILGSTENDKEGNGVSVAFYGAVNYFGTDIEVTAKMRAYLHSIGLHLRSETKTIHIPERNFIEMPIEEKQKEIAKEAEKNFPMLIGSDKSNDVKIVKFLTELGIRCERAIQEAFDSQGFGQWEPNHPFTRQRKESDSVLIGKGDAVLRKSITSKVGGK